MKIVFHAQYMENYGTVEAPRWKHKGSDEFVVANPTVAEIVAMNNSGTFLDYIGELDAAFAAEYCHGEMSYYWYAGYTVEDDNYLSESERDQLRYDGRIDYPMRDISGKLARVVNKVIKARQEWSAVA
jgi:hypothetical protein